MLYRSEVAGIAQSRSRWLTRDNKKLIWLSLLLPLFASAVSVGNAQAEPVVPVVDVSADTPI